MARKFNQWDVVKITDPSHWRYPDSGYITCYYEGNAYQAPSYDVEMREGESNGWNVECDENQLELVERAQAQPEMA